MSIGRVMYSCYEKKLSKCRERLYTSEWEKLSREQARRDQKLMAAFVRLAALLPSCLA